MEAAPGYVYGGHCRSGSPQLAAEKQGYGDQFAVEDLLDFSNEEDGGGEEEVGLDGVQVSSAGGSVVTALESSSNCSSGYDPHFSGELGWPGFVDVGLSDDLCAPYDELAELEWLSNFEESFSSEDMQNLQLISGVKSTTTSSSLSDTQSGVSTAQGRSSQAPWLLRPETHVPGKARSKRSRAAVPTSWSSRLLVLSQATSAESEATPAPTNPRPGSTAKKTPKPAKVGGSEGPAPAADGRKCLHCATDRTPQWRAGPMGPKTLCNACGVRYKSGRLVPEYRPAASPTFVISEHSNSHRKVVELRRQKELLLQQQQNHTDQFMHRGGVYEAAAGGVGAQFLLRHRVGRPDLSQLT